MKDERTGFSVPLVAEERALLMDMADMDLMANSRSRHAAMIACGLRCALLTLDALEPSPKETDQ